jgi:PAS domain S-box-containing protein
MLNGRRVVLAQKVDVTAQRLAEGRLAESEQWMRALFERSPLSSVVIDLETQRIIEANQELCEFIGRSHDEVVGRTTLELGIWDDPAPRDAFYETIRREGRVGPVDLRLRRADGSAADVALSAEVLARAGRPLLIIQAIDVTERQQAQRELARVNEELERRVGERTRELRASNEELEAFSYTVAHDLRAPLRAIDGYSHLLGDAAATGEANEVPDLLAKIRRNVTGMERLIDGLLHYARLGRQNLARVPVDMARLAAEARLTLADQYPRTGIVIEPMPTVHGDPEMLRQVLMNLLANACKFSRDVESPRVVVSARPEAGGTTFRVQDNGVGFDMAYADKLFGMFQRLHTEREFGGSGVGLAVVARIVSRHGGRAWAEGAPGRGATFSFFLPG